MIPSSIQFSSPHDLFPYDFLYNQSEILDSLTNNPKVMLQASTGYGKTVLSLVSMLYHLLNPNPSIDRIVIFIRTKTQIFRFLDYRLDSFHLFPKEDIFYSHNWKDLISELRNSYH